MKMHGKIVLESMEGSCVTQQKRICKIVQESCKNLACKTCLARARDMSLFLHDSCTILHQFLQDLARNAGNYSCSNSCKILHHFLQDMCKIVQESCKKRDISRARAKQVLHARFLQKSCMILQVRFCWGELADSGVDSAYAYG